jgi:tetratricopeptide (TPR) repeat protein
LADAERVCRSILNRERTYFDAAMLLGMILLQRGAFDEAERQFKTALELNPRVAVAERSRGIALMQLGRSEEALQCFDRAIAIKPDAAEFFANRGNTLLALQRFDEALASFDSALALKPDYADAHADRGNALQALERFEEAIASYDRAASLKPGAPAVAFNRAVALQSLNRYEDALVGYDKAIALRPGFIDALNNRGNVLKELGRFEQAVSSYDRAIAHAPHDVEALYNRGIALMELKRPLDALASYERAIALKPDHAEALFSRGLCKLLLGRLAEGFRDYQHRWRMRKESTSGAVLNTAEWSGESLKGRSILIRPERGFGDIFHFCRYLPLLAERGADVSFLVPAKLIRILKGLSDKIRLLPAIHPADRFDFQCHLMALPHRFGTELTSVPAATPYLSAEPEFCGEWRKRLGEPGFKVGISWHGGLWHGGADIAGRSILLREFYPLSQVPNIRLISLQKNDGLEQLSALPAGMNVETPGDFDNGPDAFVDTAAIMANLDLIVTCDTSIAHLAGALARPTWVALKYVPEWRWTLDRSDSPWYPAMRLFRQARPNDWSGVFAGIAAALTGVLAASGEAQRPIDSGRRFHTLAGQ